MKTNNLLRISVVGASFLFMFACKKDNSQSSTSSVTTTADVQTAADDQTFVSNENDAVSNDATAGLNSNASISGSSFDAGAKSSGTVLGLTNLLICDATISVDTTATTRTVTITYKGSKCWNNRSRTGSIVISVPKGVHWRDTGAVVSVAIDSLTITRADGKSIIINGTKTITNTSGGLLLDLATRDSIVHDFVDNLSVTFNNGKTRTWNVSKHRVFTYNDGIVITTTGSHSDGTNNNISEWGTNRFGIGFITMIVSPKVIAQSCDTRLVSGKDSTVRTDNITSSTTFGLDASGNPLTSCPSGYLYAEFIWSNGNNGKTYTYIYPY